MRPILDDPLVIGFLGCGLVTARFESVAAPPLGKRAQCRCIAEHLGKRCFRLNDPEIVKKLFDDIAPRFVDRPGGYTRIMKIGMRAGDAAEMVLLELVEE